MKNIEKNFLLLVGCVLFFISSCVSLPSKHEISRPIGKLRYRLATIFEDSNFVNAYWGVLIKSLKTGETIYARNEKKMFIPASNMKLLTTASALAILSPDFHYTTRLVALGTIKDSTLYGNIILQGSGDPTITARFNDSIPTKVFETWAESLKAKGITHINGNIIGDDNCFDEEFYGAGWPAQDETDWYAAQISGISYNDNCVDMTVAANAVKGNMCRISWQPKTEYINVINKTTTVENDSDTGIHFHRRRGTNILTVKGSLAVGSLPWVESIAVDNPTLYALTSLKEVFESKHITVSGSIFDIDDMVEQTADSITYQLASYTSPNLSEIISVTNKESQNLYAEQVFRTISLQKLGKGSIEDSRQIIYPMVARWGVDTARLQLNDGSGQSRQDLITPNDIISVLTTMYNHPYYKPFYESLAIAGVDGTLKDRMKGTRAENNVHAKTGFVNFVRSLSGYVTSQDGEMFVFSMIANNYTVPTKIAEKIQDEVCIKLAEFSRMRNSYSKKSR